MNRGENNKQQEERIHNIREQKTENNGTTDAIVPNTNGRRDACARVNAQLPTLSDQPRQHTHFGPQDIRGIDVLVGLGTLTATKEKSTNGLT